MAFIIVPLTCEDALVLDSIHTSCFQGSHKTGWDRKAFEGLLKETATCGWIAKNDNNNPFEAGIGYILAKIVGQEAEILDLAVRPFHQKQGTGKALVNELLAFLKIQRCEKIFLEVAVNNEVALSLYASLGFEIRGKRPAYYRQANQVYTDAFIMGYDFCASI